MITQSIIILALLLATYFDIKKREIPHTSVLSILIVGIYLNWQTPLFLLGGLFGMFMMFLLIPAGMAGFGEGDIKLFMAMGSVLGFHNCLEYALYVFSIAIIVVLAIKIIKGQLLQTIRDIKICACSMAVGNIKNYLNTKKEVDSIPLGVFFLPGYLMYMGVNNGVF